MPYIVYVVVWTTTFVAMALTSVIAMVPAAPLSIMIAITVMFLFFATAITSSQWLYQMLLGKTPSPSKQDARSNVPKVAPKIPPPRL